MRARGSVNCTAERFVGLLSLLTASTTSPSLRRSSRWLTPSLVRPALTSSTGAHPSRTGWSHRDAPCGGQTRPCPSRAGWAVARFHLSSGGVWPVPPGQLLPATFAPDVAPPSFPRPPNSPGDCGLAGRGALASVLWGVAACRTLGPLRG